MQSSFCHPSLQLHVYDPKLLIQVPLFSHGNELHSFTSTKINNYSISQYIWLMTHDINIQKWKVLLFLFWSLTFDWYQHVTSSSWNLSKFRNHNSHRLTWMCSNREKNRFIFNEWIVCLQEMMILWFLFWPSLQSLFCHPLEQLQT